MSDATAHTTQSAPNGADSRSKTHKNRTRYGGGIQQDFADIKDSARSILSGGMDSLTAMRRLALAELNLSRHAVARSIVWVAVGAVFGASAWLLLMTAAVVAMHYMLDLSWLAAVLISALVSAVITAIAVVMVMRFFAYTGFKSTKDELARFGFGEPEGDDEQKDRKPTFAALQRRVDRAETVAEGRRQQTLDALESTKAQARAAVTPTRILAAGAISGFVVGRSKGISGSIQRTGIASRAAYYTTGSALQGFSEIASLAVSTYSAYKSRDAADNAEVAAENAEAAADSTSPYA